MEKNPFDRNLIHKFYALKRRRNKILKINTYKMRDKLVQQLNDLHVNDPKSYWDIVNELDELHSEEGQPDENIHPRICLDNFRKLMLKVNLQLTEQQREIEKNIANHPNQKTFSTLDYHINSEEILKAIQFLKNGKSAGRDRIINEMIKSGKDELLPMLVKIFNLIYTNGNFLDTWAVSMIKPLFKGGNSFDPSDYRGISLTSCIGILFCSVLNTRLVKYMEDIHIFMFPTKLHLEKGFGQVTTFLPCRL